MFGTPSRRASSNILAVLILSSAFFSLNARAETPQTEAPPTEAVVLAYHVVESPTDSVYSISRETFRQQMQYLANTGYNVIPLADLLDYVEGRRDSLPPNPVVITVDDGWRCTYTEIYPELQQLNFPFTVFIYPKFIGRTTNHFALSWDEVKEMAENGVDIQSHSLSHPFLTYRRNPGLSDDEYMEWLHRELSRSKNVIEKETGRPVRFLAYPYGDYDTRVARAVKKAGYDAGLTCNYGPVTRGSDPFRMRRVSIYKDTSFATFRSHLGSAPLPIDVITPASGKVFDPKNPVIEAKIENHERLDPESVRISVLSLGQTPYAYNPEDGSISLVVREPLPGNEQRVVIWGADRTTGRRVEASWNFYVKRPAVAKTSKKTSTPAKTTAASDATPAEAVPAKAAALPPVRPETRGAAARQVGQNKR